jgi:hypothetical protein
MTAPTNALIAETAPVVEDSFSATFRIDVTDA